MSDELAFLDATAQADLVRRGKASATELVDAAISRIERVNGELNAVIMPLFDKARALAASRELPDGPFRGVPFLVKDIFCHTAGDPYHSGMKLLRRLGWTEKADTHLGQKFRAAGLVFVGRTNVPELGSLPTTEPDAYGPTRNPWDTARSSGGSSGGAAAAVAAGLVPAAHANDGGGSIRIPASECGLVGLKPTRGRTSLGPDAAESWAGAVAEHVVVAIELEVVEVARRTIEVSHDEDARVPLELLRPPRLVQLLLLDDVDRLREELDVADVVQVSV